MGIDITERNKAEKALREAHDVLEARVQERTKELRQKNEDLNALNEEHTATQEELRQNLEELTLRDEDLSKALAEKEVLLSEIHHRVKNNLTAFISLLSLEGAYQDTPDGRALRLDLQNRARSMALVHETLYRTHMYNEVDMGVYLANLVDQIANSFKTTIRSVKTVVDAHGIMLDIPRATPAGLIVNELMTNAFKHAFPESAVCGTPQSDPCTFRVEFTQSNGYIRSRSATTGLVSRRRLTSKQRNPSGSSSCTSSQSTSSGLPLTLTRQAAQNIRSGSGREDFFRSRKRQDPASSLGKLPTTALMHHG